MRIMPGLVMLALLPACARACKNDHPYVPYSVESATAPGPEDDASAPGLDAGADAQPAFVAPPGTSRWSVGGIDIVAPAGREFVSAIVEDFDGDERKDAVVLVRPSAADAAEGNAPVEIVHYARDVATTVAVTPQARAEEGCSPVNRIERVGPHSVAVESGATCARGAVSRELYVVRVRQTARVALELTIRDPAGAPKLTVDVDGADRNRDGTDDVTLRITVEGGTAPFEPGPKLSARLAFFDHPAGATPDSDEPSASLQTIAALATSRVHKEPATVPGLVQQMRALYRAMCQEGGAPRLVKPKGGGFLCGPSKPLEEAGVAELRSFVARGDVLRALAAADVVQRAPATKSAARTTEITKYVNEIAPILLAKGARTLGVPVSAARGIHPEWGPLAFEASGTLLVRGSGKVMRVDPRNGDSSDADIAPWGNLVVSPNGQSRWLEAYHACEGVSLRATFAPTGETGDVRDVLLPIAPTLGARCTGARGEAVTSVPIAWTARGLEALVAGQPVLMQPDSSSAMLIASQLTDPPPLGSPRSPDGKFLAVRTSAGILLRGVRSARYRVPELEPYDDVASCTVSDDATHLACVKRGRALLIDIDPP